MTVTMRKAGERGEKRRDWLDARYSFSYGDYYDPRHMGFGALRAMNEYRLPPGAGLDPAARSELEILVFVVDGALEHADSLGAQATLGRGGFGRLSAGSGAELRLRNASATDPVHFVQIWILPESRGAAPRSDRRAVADGEGRDAPRLIAAKDGRDNALVIDRDVDLFLARPAADASFSHPLGPGREVWLQVLRGAVRANGAPLAAGDGVGLRDEAALDIQGVEAAEVLLFDMARDG